MVAVTECLTDTMAPAFLPVGAGEVPLLEGVEEPPLSVMHFVWSKLAEVTNVTSVHW